MARFYQFCREKGRREFFVDLQNDHYSLAQDLLEKRDNSKLSRIRFMFKFTSREGLVTYKIFQSLDKLEHFLLWDRAYGREVKGVQKKPDWSSNGLCSYSKEVTMGVIDSKGGAVQGFLKGYQFKYYGEESE